MKALLALLSLLLAVVVGCSGEQHTVGGQ